MSGVTPAFGSHPEVEAQRIAAAVRWVEGEADLQRGVARDALREATRLVRERRPNGDPLPVVHLGASSPNAFYTMLAAIEAGWSNNGIVMVANDLPHSPGSYVVEGLAGYARTRGIEVTFLNKDFSFRPSGTGRLPRDILAILDAIEKMAGDRNVSVIISTQPRSPAARSPGEGKRPYWTTDLTPNGDGRLTRVLVGVDSPEGLQDYVSYTGLTPDRWFSLLNGRGKLGVHSDFATFVWRGNTPASETYSLARDKLRERADQWALRNSDAFGRQVIIGQMLSPWGAAGLFHGALATAVIAEESRILFGDMRSPHAMGAIKLLGLLDRRRDTRMSEILKRSMTAGGVRGSYLDFGGHEEAIFDAVTRAMSELDRQCWSENPTGLRVPNYPDALDASSSAEIIDRVLGVSKEELQHRLRALSFFSRLAAGEETPPPPLMSEIGNDPARDDRAIKATAELISRKVGGAPFTGGDLTQIVAARLAEVDPLLKTKLDFLDSILAGTPDLDPSHAEALRQRVREDHRNQPRQSTEPLTEIDKMRAKQRVSKILGDYIKQECGAQITGDVLEIIADGVRERRAEERGEARDREKGKGEK